jgi:hypothetical protein
MADGRVSGRQSEYKRQNTEDRILERWNPGTQEPETILSLLIRKQMIIFVL